MAVTNGYLTVSEARSLLGIGDNADDMHLELAIEAACRAIDDFCGRRFYNDSETRYYTPSDSSRLRVDDLVSVTTLKTDAGGDGTYETTWTTSDYRLGPDNASTDGRPYTEVRRAPSGSYTFPLVDRGVEIVGTFGWPSAPPKAVKQAAAMQAARLFKRSTEAPFGVAAVGLDGTAMRLMAKLDADVEMLVRPYRKMRVA